MVKSFPSKTLLSIIEVLSLGILIIEDGSIVKFLVESRVRSHQSYQNIYIYTCWMAIRKQVLCCVSITLDWRQNSPEISSSLFAGSYHFRQRRRLYKTKKIHVSGFKVTKLWWLVHVTLTCAYRPASIRPLGVVLREVGCCCRIMCPGKHLFQFSPAPSDGR